MSGPQAVQVRFLSGSRADQTPAAIKLAGNWQDVQLVREELVASAGGRGRPVRRYLVRTKDGLFYRIQPSPHGWSAAPGPQGD